MMGSVHIRGVLRGKKVDKKMSFPLEHLNFKKKKKLNLPINTGILQVLIE